MAKEKVEAPKEVPAKSQEQLDLEAGLVKDTKVLSLRPGKVVLQDGQELLYRSTVVVSKKTADWLVDSYKPLMQIV